MAEQQRAECSATSLSYDFKTRSGRIHVRAGDQATMKSCIDLFTTIDPQVSQIKTYVGRLADTSFERGPKGWTKRVPSRLSGMA